MVLQISGLLDVLLGFGLLAIFPSHAWFQALVVMTLGTVFFLFGRVGWFYCLRRFAPRPSANKLAKQFGLHLPPPVEEPIH